MTRININITIVIFVITASLLLVSSLLLLSSPSVDAKESHNDNSNNKSICKKGAINASLPNGTLSMAKLFERAGEAIRNC